MEYVGDRVDRIPSVSQLTFMTGSSPFQPFAKVSHTRSDTPQLLEKRDEETREVQHFIPITNFQWANTHKAVKIYIDIAENEMLNDNGVELSFAENKMGLIIEVQGKKRRLVINNLNKKIEDAKVTIRSEENNRSPPIPKQASLLPVLGDDIRDSRAFDNGSSRALSPEKRKRIVVRLVKVDPIPWHFLTETQREAPIERFLGKGTTPDAVEKALEGDLSGIIDSC